MVTAILPTVHTDILNMSRFGCEHTCSRNSSSSSACAHAVLVNSTPLITIEHEHDHQGPTSLRGSCAIPRSTRPQAGGGAHLVGAHGDERGEGLAGVEEEAHDALDGIVVVVRRRRLRCREAVVHAAARRLVLRALERHEEARAKREHACDELLRNAHTNAVSAAVRARHTACART